MDLVKTDVNSFQGLSGADPEILKRGGARWSKKAKITLQTKAFSEIFLSVFSNFLHFYVMKACR